MTRVLGIDTSLTGTGLARVDVRAADQIPGVTDDMTGVTFSAVTATVSAPKPGADKSKHAMARRVNALIDQIEGALFDPGQCNCTMQGGAVYNAECPRHDPALRPAGTPDLIVMESLAYGAKGAGVWVLPWIFGRVLELAVKYQIPLFDVGTGQIKKYATGSGNADKATVMLAVSKRWPQADVRNDNESDAMTAAAIGCDWLGLPIVGHHAKYHAEVMAKIKETHGG